VVDDGIATGMTVKAALLSLHKFEPGSLALAVPLADREVAADLSQSWWIDWWSWPSWTISRP
jgi:putative phosphoribosyl transferase